MRVWLSAIAWSSAWLHQVDSSVVVSLKEAAEALEVLSLPVIVDNARDAINISVREGDDWVGNVEKLAKKLGLTRDNVAIVNAAIESRASQNGMTLQSRWFVVVASATWPVDSKTAANALWRTLMGVGRHAARRAFNVLLVTDGFSLMPKSREKFTALLGQFGAARVLLIETDEWEGVSSCVNHALKVIPARSVVTVVPWALELRDALAEDVFVAYERLARAYGREGRFVAYIASHAEWLLTQMPLFIADAASFQAFGALDEGFVYTGGVAKWLDRASAIQAPPEWLEMFVVDSVMTEGWHDSTDAWPDTTPPAGETQARLKQLDADAYYLERLPIGIDNTAILGSPSRYDWMATRLTPISERRWRRDRDGTRDCVAAMICVYDDVRFLESLLEDLLPRIHSALLVQSSRPWYGPTRKASHEAAAFLLARLARDPKVSVVRGSWKTEEDQRNFAMQLAKLLPQRPTHLLVVDGDEFWHPVELDRALALVSDREESGFRVGWARATMTTYWKSTRTIISPPEPLRILWLVAVADDAGLENRSNSLECSFSEARNWGCSANGFGSDNGSGIHARMDSLGVYVDASTAICHHLSYVRTTSELGDKMASFAHAADVRSGWMHDIWRRWDDNHNLSNLHPTHPPAFAGTIEQPLWALPPALRRLSLRAKKELDQNCTESTARLFCKFLSPHSKSRLELGQPPTSDQSRRSDQNIPNECASSLATVERSVHSRGHGRLKWTQLAPKNYVSDLPITDIAASDMTIVDEDPHSPRCLPPDGRPRIIILIIGEGVLDTSTYGVFEDAAKVVRDALLSLGVSAKIRWCPDLRFCSFEGRALLIILGVHHLGRYWYNERSFPSYENHNETSRPMIEFTGWPDPRASILYNFEQSDHAEDLAPRSRLWRIFGRWSELGTLWDFSAANVLRLARPPYNIVAQHVPLGYAESLEPSSNGNEHRDIDVLFVGRYDGTRVEKLWMLRQSGLNILHGNSDGPLFGSRLSEHLKRAKIVLSLNYWSNESEWKMTRYLPAFDPASSICKLYLKCRPLFCLFQAIAHGALVISEHAGAPEERTAWGDAIVFVTHGTQLIEACHYFLRNGSARMEQVTRGRSILFQRLAAESLAVPVSCWLRNVCPNWTLSRPVRSIERDKAVWQWKVSMRTQASAVGSTSIDRNENSSSSREYELVPADRYVWQPSALGH